MIFRKIVRLLAVIAPERLRFAALNPTVILKTPIAGSGEPETSGALLESQLTILENSSTLEPADATRGLCYFRLPNFWSL